MPFAALVLAVLLIPVDAIPSRVVGQEDQPLWFATIDAKGRRLATSTSVRLRVWDLKREKLLWEAPRRGETPVGLGLSDDGVLLEGNGDTPLLRYYEDGEESGPAVSGPSKTNSPAVCMTADPEGRWGWIGSEAGTLFRLTPGDSRGWSRRALKNGGVTCVDADLAGKLVAVGGKDHSVHIVDASAAQRKEVLEGHEGIIRCVALDAKGGRVASADSQGSVRLWNPKNGRELLALPDHTSSLTALALTTRTSWIATGDHEGVLRIFSTKGGELLAEVDTDQGAFRSLRFTPDGKHLLSLQQGADHARLWSVDKAL